MIPNVNLSVADIANPDMLACGCRILISLDIARFYEGQCQPSSRPDGWLAPITVNRVGESTQFAQRFARPLGQLHRVKAVSFGAINIYIIVVLIDINLLLLQPLLLDYMI